MQRITIVTLFAGRYHTLEQYLEGLDNLDYPKKSIHLLWVTNSQKRMFLDILKQELERRKSDYASVRLKIVPIAETANAFVENGTGSIEHGDTIAALYNTAYQYIMTDYFLCLEDDIYAPSHTIKRFLKAMKPPVGYVTGVVFDRHKKQMFGWNVVLVQRYLDKRVIVDYVPTKILHQFGVRKIGVGGLACTMLCTSILNTLPKPLFQAKTPLSIELIGCDLVLCLKLMLAGYHCLLDFDVRAHHYDSQGNIH